MDDKKARYLVDQGGRPERLITTNQTTWRLIRLIPVTTWTVSRTT
jgi:hypothetical protein